MTDINDPQYPYLAGQAMKADCLRLEREWGGKWRIQSRKIDTPSLESKTAILDEYIGEFRADYGRMVLEILSKNRLPRTASFEKDGEFMRLYITPNDAQKIFENTPQLLKDYNIGSVREFLEEEFPEPPVRTQ